MFVRGRDRFGLNPIAIAVGRARGGGKVARRNKFPASGEKRA